MHTIKLEIKDSIYDHIMFLLKNLNSKELKIIEDKKMNDYGSQDNDKDIYAFSNHAANTVEEWHNTDEDEIWK
jgi:hypothetical protein